MATIVYWEARGSAIFDTDDPAEAEERAHNMLNAVSQGQDQVMVDDIETNMESYPR